jgi:hypothetical protein
MKQRLRGMVPRIETLLKSVGMASGSQLEGNRSRDQGSIGGQDGHAEILAKAIFNFQSTSVVPLVV